MSEVPGWVLCFGSESALVVAVDRFNDRETKGMTKASAVPATVCSKKKIEKSAIRFLRG